MSSQLAEASHDVDLVVLEGMGRAIETNLHANLTCDKLNLGMIKHPEVCFPLRTLILHIFCTSLICLNAFLKRVYCHRRFARVLKSSICLLVMAPTQLKHISATF